MLEKMLRLLESDTDTVTKTGGIPENTSTTHGLEMWADAEGNLIDSVSVSDRSLSHVQKSDSPSTHSTHRSYREIRYVRSLYPGMKVKEFCAKFGISEQAFYWAMRKRK